jgi:hypothetical protein
MGKLVGGRWLTTTGLGAGAVVEVPRISLCSCVARGEEVIWASPALVTGARSVLEWAASAARSGLRALPVSAGRERRW